MTSRKFDFGAALLEIQEGRAAMAARHKTQREAWFRKKPPQATAGAEAQDEVKATKKAAPTPSAGQDDVKTSRPQVKHGATEKADKPIVLKAAAPLRTIGRDVDPHVDKEDADRYVRSGAWTAAESVGVPWAFEKAQAINEAIGLVPQPEVIEPTREQGEIRALGLINTQVSSDAPGAGGIREIKIDRMTKDVRQALRDWQNPYYPITAQVDTDALLVPMYMTRGGDTGVAVEEIRHKLVPRKVDNIMIQEYGTNDMGTLTPSQRETIRERAWEEADQELRAVFSSPDLPFVERDPNEVIKDWQEGTNELSVGGFVPWLMGQLPNGVREIEDMLEGTGLVYEGNQVSEGLRAALAPFAIALRPSFITSKYFGVDNYLPSHQTGEITTTQTTRQHRDSFVWWLADRGLSTVVGSFVLDPELYDVRDPLNFERWGSWRHLAKIQSGYSVIDDFWKPGELLDEAAHAVFSLEKGTHTAENFDAAMDVFSLGAQAAMIFEPSLFALPLTGLGKAARYAKIAERIESVGAGSYRAARIQKSIDDWLALPQKEQDIGKLTKNLEDMGEHGAAHLILANVAHQLEMGQSVSVASVKNRLVELGRAESAIEDSGRALRAKGATQADLNLINEAAIAVGALEKTLRQSLRLWENTGSLARRGEGGTALVRKMRKLAIARGTLLRRAARAVQLTVDPDAKKAIVEGIQALQEAQVSKVAGRDPRLTAARKIPEFKRIETWHRKAHEVGRELNELIPLAQVDSVSQNIARHKAVLSSMYRSLKTQHGVTRAEFNALRDGAIKLGYQGHDFEAQVRNIVGAWSKDLAPFVGAPVGTPPSSVRAKALVTSFKSPNQPFKASLRALPANLQRTVETFRAVFDPDGTRFRRYNPEIVENTKNAIRIGQQMQDEIVLIARHDVENFNTLTRKYLDSTEAIDLGVKHSAMNTGNLSLWSKTKSYVKGQLDVADELDEVVLGLSRLLVPGGRATAIDAGADGMLRKGMERILKEKPEIGIDEFLDEMAEVTRKVVGKRSNYRVADATDVASVDKITTFLATATILGAVKYEYLIDNARTFGPRFQPKALAVRHGMEGRLDMIADFEMLLRGMHEMGIPDPFISEVGRNLKSASEALQSIRAFGKTPMGEAGILPKELIDKVDSTLQGAAKTLDPWTAKAVGEIPMAGSMLQNVIRWWRTNVLLLSGLGYGYLVSNAVSELSQLTLKRGFAEASGTVAHNLTAYVAPINANMSIQKLPILSRVFADPRIQAIWEMSDEVLPGTKHTYADIARAAGKRGVLDSFAAQETARTSLEQAAAFRRKGPGLFKGIAHMEEELSLIAAQGAQKGRMQLFLSEIEAGKTFDEAAKTVRDVFFDWTFGIPDWELAAFSWWSAFWRARRMQGVQTGKALLSPLLSPDWEKGLKGRTELDRFRQISYIAAHTPEVYDEVSEWWKTGATTDEPLYGDEAYGEYLRRIYPWHKKKTDWLLYNNEMSKDEREFWKKTTGRNYTHGLFSLSPVGVIDGLEFIKPLVLATTGVIHWAGGGKLPNGWWDELIEPLVSTATPQLQPAFEGMFDYLRGDGRYASGKLRLRDGEVGFYRNMGQWLGMPVPLEYRDDGVYANAATLNTARMINPFNATFERLGRIINAYQSDEEKGLARAFLTQFLSVIRYTPYAPQEELDAQVEQRKRDMEELLLYYRQDAESML